MKKWLVVVGVAVGLVVAVGGGCGFAGKSLAGAIWDDRPDIFSRWWPVVRWCTNGLPFVDQLPELLNNRTYIVLLQNNKELRPTGGFMGSYVRLRFAGGGLASMDVVDIYQPDGQLPGHVEPPYPVAEAFGQGWWKLRDANWDPDMASAAATVRWFLQQGGETRVDGMVGVNLDLMKEWLGAVGQVNVVTYGETVNADNLYSLAQKYAEASYKPNSTSKRDFLGAVGTALVEKTKAAGVVTEMKLAKTIWQELKSGQMWVWMADPGLEQVIENKRWGGQLVRGPAAASGQAGDYLYVVETNLGANKANCCVSRTVAQNISGQSEQVVIDWKNTSQYPNPVPPVFWGGNYIDYVRVIIPGESKVQSIKVQDKLLRRATAADFALPNSLRYGRSEDMFDVEPRPGGLQSVGFWAVVPAGGSAEAQVVYSTPSGFPPNLGGEQKWGYQSLRIDREPGIESFLYKLTDNGKIIFNGVIDKERDFGLYNQGNGGSD